MVGIAALTIVQDVVLVLVILLALIYSIPILFLRRFHTVNNVFTVNLCLAALCCSVYWLLYNTMADTRPAVVFLQRSCVAFSYFEMMCILQVPFAVVLASVHRLCSVVYHSQPFYKTKRWAAICIVTQWVFGALISLPMIAFNRSSCDTNVWERVYTLIMCVIIPMLICLNNNILIFRYVRSSTSRVQSLAIAPKGRRKSPIGRRDLHLLRHMIVMFCIFVGGWSPIAIYSIMSHYNASSIVRVLFTLLAELSLLLDVGNLFLYNRGLRRCFRSELCS